MDALYISLWLITIVGSLLSFTWIIMEMGNHTAYRLTLEPHWNSNNSWLLPNRKPVFNISSFPGDSNFNIQRYHNTAINEEETRLMAEVDNITDENELREWFKLLKTEYEHKNIPKKVYLRVSTILNGYVWFDEKEYLQRIDEDKPVHKVTKREYLLEKKLDSLIASHLHLREKDGQY